jgi:transposase
VASINLPGRTELWLCSENLLAYSRHHIANAVSEGLNSKIQSLKSAARGFRNFQNHRMRILFFSKKLNLNSLGAS